MCLPRLPIAKVVVLNVLHVHHICSICCRSLNSAFIWQIPVGLHVSRLGAQGPPCGCQTVMQPSWRLFLTAWAEPCPREVRWRSFCRAQAVPLPPLPPFRSRGQSCSLRPPLPVHWPVSLDLLLGLDTANLPTIKKLLAHNLLQNHYFTDVVLPPWPPQ